MSNVAHLSATLHIFSDDNHFSQNVMGVYGPLGMSSSPRISQFFEKVNDKSKFSADQFCVK